MSLDSGTPGESAGARHLKRGRRMPDLALPTTAGRSVNFAELSGRAVVFCYPWTGRPGQPNPPSWDDIPGAHGSTPEAEGSVPRALDAPPPAGLAACAVASAAGA